MLSPPLDARALLDAIGGVADHDDPAARNYSVYSVVSQPDSRVSVRMSNLSCSNSPDHLYRVTQTGVVIEVCFSWDRLCEKK